MRTKAIKSKIRGYEEGEGLLVGRRIEATTRKRKEEISNEVEAIRERRYLLEAVEQDAKPWYKRLCI